MFKEGDFVVYRNRVCKIKNIKKTIFLEEITM